MTVRRITALPLVSLALVVGCGDGSEDKPGEAKLTHAESALLSTFGSATTAYCDPYQEDYTLDPNTRASLENVLTIGAAGVVSLARDKPDAIYDDMFALGEVPVTTKLRALSQDLSPCGSFGSDLSVKLGRVASANG